jgi:hypothetical protein
MAVIPLREDGRVYGGTAQLFKGMSWASRTTDAGISRRNARAGLREDFIGYLLIPPRPLLWKSGPKVLPKYAIGCHPWKAE